MLYLIKQYLSLVLPFLWKDTKSKIATLATLLLTGIDILTATVIPWLSGKVLQSSTTPRFTTIALLTMLWISCWGIQKISQPVRSIILFQVVNQAIRTIRLRIITHLHQLPWSLQATYHRAEILSASNRVSSSIRLCMGKSLLTLLPACCKIGTLTIASLSISLQTGYFLPLVLLGYIPMLYSSMRHFLHSRYNAWEQTDHVLITTDDSLHNTKWARFHLSTETERLEKQFNTEAQKWTQNNTHLQTIYLVQALWFMLVTGGYMLHLLTLLRAKKLLLTDFVTLQGYSFMLYTQLHTITEQTRSFLSSVIDVQKIIELLALPTQQANQPIPHSIPKNQPILHVADLSFSFPNQAPILQHCNITCYPGDKIAITGPSGAGKSTLCHLLAGIYTPTQGTILLKGVPMQQLSILTIGHTIHFIPQEAPLLTGTIAENVQFARLKNPNNPLAYLTQQLEKPTGEQGSQCSSGEKQRILLARCLAYNPEVLILDETCSALDKVNAQAILKMIIAQIPTVIFVTHRQSLLSAFQRCYYLENRTLSLLHAR